jgi:hypothetical protein
MKPTIEPAALRRLLPALRRLVRFPTKPIATVSTELAVELSDLQAWIKAHGRPTPATLEELEDQLGDQPAQRSEPVDTLPPRRATPPPPGAAAGPAPVKPWCDSARNQQPGLPISKSPPPSVSPSSAPLAKPAADIGQWLQAQRLRLTGRVTCFQVEVTPAHAAAWLRFNLGNRKPSRAKIRRFAAAMAAGRWTCNGETVKFSATGRLIDGQSRLQAIELAGVPVVLEVRGGLPDASQQTMDSGELRRGTHTLEMLGEANPGILAPALKLVWLWSKGWLAGSPFGAPRVLENLELAPLLAAHPGLRASAGWTVSSGCKCDRYLLRSEAAFFHHLFGAVDARLRDSFFEAVLEGIGLTKVSPAYHLRERLPELRLGDDTASRKAQRRALVIKAWNFAQAHQPCVRLVQAPDDAFPDIAGLPPPVRVAVNLRRLNQAKPARAA